VGKRRARAGLAALVVITAGAVPAALGAPASARTTDPVFPDFDSDGRADVVISVDQEDIGNVVDAGAVQVFYGGPTGPFSAGFSRDQVWSQASTGIIGDTQEGGRFGDDWAAGDFNGDEYDDLAIGEWGATVDRSVTDHRADAGMVHIIYGGDNGLAVGNGYQRIHRESTGVPGNAAVNDQFGRAVASGDLNGDSTDDLVIGCPRCDVGATNSGAVYAFAGGGGTNGMIDTRDDRYFAQSPAGGATDLLEDQADPSAVGGDILGSALAVGDFDNDDNADIAAGAQGETLNDLDLDPANDVASSGAFHLMYGDGTFANVGVSQDFFTEAELGGATANARLGCEFAPGDFNGDGIDDLAVCADGKRVGSATNAGSVYVLKGTGGGLSGTAPNRQLWNFSTGGVRGDAQPNDNWGDSITAGDFNNDGREDLAIAVDRRNLDGIAGVDHGTVLVFPGSANMVSVNSGKYKGFSENTRGVPSDARSNDIFGSLLQTFDVEGNGYDDLYIAAAGETVGSQAKAGGLFLLKGSSRGVTSSGSKYYTQATSKIDDSAETSDFFAGT
jgi:hypothetical protein